MLWTPSNNIVSNNTVSSNNVSFNNWVKSPGISEEKMNEVINNKDGKDISRFASRSSKFKKEYPYMEDLVSSYYATSFSNLIKPIRDPYGNVVTPLQQAIYREDYSMIDFLLDNNVPSGKQPDGLTIIETVLRSSIVITNKHALIKEFIDKYNIKLTKTEETLYKKLISNVLNYKRARNNASWFWPVKPSRTTYKGGKHHKTHHHKRRTLRKKHTKTRRHHRK